MKKFKKIKISALFLSLLVFLLAMTSCSEQIKDSNGPDDFSLVELTDEDILATSVTAHVTEPDGPNDKGNGVTTFSDSRISGVKEIVRYEANGDEHINGGILKVTVDSEVRAGNVKILLVKKANANSVEAEFEIGEGKSAEIADPRGVYMVRIGAESADIDIKVKLEFVPTAK